MKRSGNRRGCVGLRNREGLRAAGHQHSLRALPQHIDAPGVGAQNGRMGATCTPRNPHVRPKRFQISLRTLLLGTAVTAVGCWALSQGVWEVVGNPLVEFESTAWQSSSDGHGIVVLEPNPVSVTQPHPRLARFFDFLYGSTLVLIAGGLVWGLGRAYQLRRQRETGSQ